MGLRILAAIVGLALCARPARALKIERVLGVSSSGGALEVVAEEVMVRFGPALSAQERAARAQVAGGRVLQEFPFIGWSRVSLAPGTKVMDGVAALKALPGVLDAEPDLVLRPNRTPNDPLVGSQYALSQVNAFAAWAYELGSSSRVTVAVIDTGIDGAHADLSGKLVGQSQLFNRLPDNDLSRAPTAANDPPTAACNHATRVAGVAAATADNGVGIAGMSWGAGLISMKVFNDADCAASSPSCDCATSNAAVISALDYLRTIHNTAAVGRIVANISLGEGGAPCKAAVQAAVTAAVNAGIVVVVAAGNDGSAVQQPANCSGVIPVGATDASNAIPAFSSRGPELAQNGLVAPGVAVLTTDLGNANATTSGTSFSAPMVAGMAALILSARPDFTPAQVAQTLRNSADNIGVSSLGTLGLDAGGRPQGESSGAGRLNAFKAMRLAVKGTLAGFDGDVKSIAFPNPFRVGQDKSVTITVPVDIQGSKTKIKIYNTAGELVRETSNQSWDGKNNDGIFVGAGTYLFVVSTDKGNSRGRLSLIR